jgi:hypothetical protein
MQLASNGEAHMPSNKKLVPQTGKLANPKVPIDANHPKSASPSYQADARGPADQDGNEEQARRQGAAGPARHSTHKPRPAKR